MLDLYFFYLSLLLGIMDLVLLLSLSSSDSELYLESH